MQQDVRSEPAASGALTREARLTLIGIMLGIFLAALDQTIVSTALPRITAELNGTRLYAWVATAYLLASTVAAPVFGRLTELYSRRSVLLAAVVLFLAGSALCGLSPNMEALIGFRGFQGIGGGALFSVALTTIAHLFPPRERGKVGGLFGAMFGLSSVVGPWLGGLLTDHFSWRWIFYINMPVGAVALWFILRFMPRMRPEHQQTFDVPGALTLVAWTVPLMLAFSWAGSTYPWGSTRIISLFVFSAVALGVWIWTQLRTKDPLFDLSILRIRTFSLASIAMFFYGGAFLGAIIFLPLYLVQVKGISATNAGLSLLPLSFGVVVGAISSGQLASRIGRYKPILLVSGVWMLALFLFTHFTLAVETPIWQLVAMLFALGLGLGPGQSLFTLAAQNAAPMERMGSATAATQFVRQIGSTIGAAIMGTVLSSTLQHEIPKHMPAGFRLQGNSFEASELRTEAGVDQALDKTFGKLEQQLAAALKGDKEAYAALKADPKVPVEFKDKLVEGGIPAIFQKLEGQVVAALGGDQKAYADLVANKDLPKEFKDKLAPGGIPAQVKAKLQETLGLLEKALAGDAAAAAKLRADPRLDPRIKGLLDNPPPPAARGLVLERTKRGLLAQEKKMVAGLEAELIPQIQSSLRKAQDTTLKEATYQVTRNLEEVRQELKTELPKAINIGITEAERQVFLWAAILVLCSLFFAALLPNEALKPSFEKPLSR